MSTSKLAARAEFERVIPKTTEVAGLVSVYYTDEEYEIAWEAWQIASSYFRNKHIAILLNRAYLTEQDATTAAIILSSE